ncbi:hypothetical protein [Phenylobacterium sp.]|uniref:hypothetical protein n=1 Tax=Phenylobacterium sp. TaxID=1871053 RepID=UPI0035B42BD0
MIARWQIAMAAVLTILGLAAVLYWSGRRDGAARERPRTEAARAEAAVASLETQGARATVRRVEVVVRQREAAVQSAARATEEALKAEDADAPLDDARAGRLRAHDRELCLAAPDLAGCP